MTNDERAQIRAEAVREAVMWLNNHVGDLLYGEDQPEDDGHTVARANAISFAAKDMERALLRPDPAEASKPLSSAHRVNAPVDHGPGAAAMDEAGKLDEATVRACLAVLPMAATDNGEIYRTYAVKAIKALLPKPDPAKELVEEYERFLRGEGRELTGVVRSRLLCFASRLIDTGLLNP